MTSGNLVEVALELAGVEFIDENAGQLQGELYEVTACHPHRFDVYTSYLH